MRRPQSAKPGFRGYWPQNSQSQTQQNENLARSINRKNVKLVKPDLTTNDFARILPKKIYQDKQHLYSEGLRLKQNLNEILQENTRLKTRISILEKEKDKLTKHLEGGRDNIGSKISNPNSRLNIYGNAKNNEKQNMMVRNLKKMVREGKEEIEYLKQQNAKIKKAIKYTKINELQIERKMLLEQNRRLVNIIDQCEGKLAEQERNEREAEQLKRALEQQIYQQQRLEEENQKCMEYIQELEQKFNSEVQKFHGKETKLQREATFSKRKMHQALRQVENLKKKLNEYDDQKNSHVSQKKSNRLTRPVTSNPYKQGGLSGVRIATEHKKQQANKQNNQSLKQLQNENKRLKEELERANRLLLQDEKKKSEEIQSTSPVVQVQPIKQTSDNNQPIIVEDSGEKSLQHRQQTNQRKNQKNQENDYENQYDEFEEAQNQSYAKNTKREGQSQLDQYKRQIEQSGGEENLFVKEDQEQQKEDNQQRQTKKKKKQKKEKTGYKPDKSILREIKQILTYRMKAQRYPYGQLKKDIMQANEKKFSYTELQAMFGNQPFYLTQNYVNALLQYSFEKKKPSPTTTLTNDVLLQKLRKVIDEFDLLQEAEQEEMLLRIAEMVTQYPSELAVAFEKIKNGQDTVRKADLYQLFRKLELDDKYIQIIIQQLSLCSPDLEHLNYQGFFERFYIESQDTQNQPGKIDEEQGEYSEQESEENNKKKKDTKLNQIKKQFEDNDQYLDYDENQKLSLGDNQNNNYQEHEIVSDDGPL